MSNNDQIFKPFTNFADVPIPFVNGDIIENPASYLGASGYSYELRFYNNSHDIIYLGRRDGTTVKLPPDKTSSNYNIIMIEHIAKTNNGIIETIHGTDDMRLNYIKKKLVLERGNGYRYIESVDINTIRKHKHGIYLLSSDTTLSLTNESDCVIHHPYSSQRLYNSFLLNTSDYDPESDIHISIRFIDNEGVLPAIYVIINGRVMIVKSRTMKILDDGIYISGFSKYNGCGDNYVREHDKFTIEDVENNKTPFLIYKTLDEANTKLASLSMDGKVNLELEKAVQREHDMAMAEIKRIREENALKTTMVEDNLKLETTKHELAMEAIKKEHELKILQMKSETESIVSSNKRDTETIKLVAGGVALAALLFKIIK